MHVILLEAIFLKNQLYAVVLTRFGVLKAMTSYDINCFLKFELKIGNVIGSKRKERHIKDSTMRHYLLYNVGYFLMSS